MRVFVTGSTGLLGNNLVRHLLARGHEVLALTRSVTKFRHMLGDTTAVPVQGDMSDVPALAEYLSDCGAVFHTAAYFREYYARGDHAAALQAINVEGTLRLLELADTRGVAAFVHTSSSGTIGKRADGLPGDEDTPPSAAQLKNLYFRSKHEGDGRIRGFVPKGRLRVIEILPGWMFGPGDAGPTAAGQLVLDLLARKVPGVPEGGACVVDARDVAQAMLSAADQPHGSRFAVAGPYLTLREVVDSIAEAAGTRPPALDLPAWLAETYAFVAERWAAWTKTPTAASYQGVRVITAKHRISSARAERDLDVRFRPFIETARDVLAWYAEHGLAGGRHVAALQSARS